MIIISLLQANNNTGVRVSIRQTNLLDDTVEGVNLAIALLRRRSRQYASLFPVISQ